MVEEEEARRLIHELVGFWGGGFGIRYPIVGDPCQRMTEQGGIIRRGEELKQGFGQRTRQGLCRVRQAVGLEF